MMSAFRSIVTFAALASLCHAAVGQTSLHAGVSAAQWLPPGPVRVIVSGSVGGPSDAAIRLLSPRLSEALRQPVVVDNRPGAVGQAAAEQLKGSTPDGRTLMVGNNGTHAIVPSLYKNVRYDPIRDFAPIALINSSRLVLVAHPKMQASSLAEVLALSRKEPGKIIMGVAGPTGEIAAEALMASTQTRFNNIRYKGSSPAEVAALSGEVDVALLTPIASLPHVSSGKLRAIAITTNKRLQLLPLVPTVAELGVDGYSFELWNALFAPAGTPNTVVRALHRSVLSALADGQTRERFAALGFTSIGSSPEELTSVIKQESEKYRKIIAKAGIRAE